MPPMHWVASQRITGARRLLADSGWSPSGVGQQHG